MSAVDPGEILDLLPQRYPCALLDRVDEIVPGERLVASRQVRADEPWCVGHFPGDPVMPGVLQLEALVQAIAALAARTQPGLQGLSLTGLDKVRFRRKVVPGDLLRLEVSVARVRGSVWTVRGAADVAGERACEARILATLQPPRD